MLHSMENCSGYGENVESTSMAFLNLYIYTRHEHTLSNKTVAMFGSFVLYVIYKVRVWELYLALVR